MTSRTRISSVLKPLGLTASATLLAISALPAYAASSQPGSAPTPAPAGQSLAVSQATIVSGVTAERYSSSDEASGVAGWSGPSVAELLANPPYPNFDLDGVYQAALALRGTPYALGGDTPAGFDCSGYVMYVYAQFGLALPHSADGQAALGRRISEADARPGDIVMMAGHNGFWAGPGQILHAPYPGAAVRIQTIWDDYYIVRLGV